MKNVCLVTTLLLLLTRTAASAFVAQAGTSTAAALAQRSVLPLRLKQQQQQRAHLSDSCIQSTKQRCWPTTVTTTSSALQMSDVPKEKEDGSTKENNKNDNNLWKFKNWKDSLPPSPEDQLIMTGDIVALFVYSFLDHTLTEMYIDQTLHNAATSAPMQLLADSSLDNALLSSSHGALPVWLDALHYSSSMYSPHYVLSIMGLPEVHYSPIISSAGLASVVLTSCWLLSGWLGGAFLFCNTLHCQTSRALVVTMRTWLTTCVLVVLLAAVTNVCWLDCIPPALTSTVGDATAAAAAMDSGGAATAAAVRGAQAALLSLTKADADYIFDSLTVLLTWRFLVSAMLGSGK